MARQNNRLPNPRLTRFNAVRQFILDEKCGVRSRIARMRIYLTNHNPTVCSVELTSIRLARGQGNEVITHRSDGGVGPEGKRR
jgi:hypothetical protein